MPEHKRMRRDYSSLNQLKNEITRKGDEKVLEFTGEYLYTRRGRKKIRYGLFQGNVSCVIVS